MAIDLIALATHPVVLAGICGITITAAVVVAVEWATSTKGEDITTLAPEAEPDTRYVTRVQQGDETTEI